MATSLKLCSRWSSVPKHQPALKSGIIVSTAACDLGDGPEANQWDCFTKALFPNAGLYCGPAQLPDRRHKHTMALNMEIHQACEMFQLWSHSFQHLSRSHTSGVQWGGGGWGALMAFKCQIRTLFFFFLHFSYLSSGWTKTALNETSLGACKKTNKKKLVWAVPSSCPGCYGPRLFPCALITGHAPPCQAGISAKVFVSCHVTESSQHNRQPYPWQKSYVEVGGWGWGGGGGGLQRCRKERVQWTLLSAAVMSNGAGLWEPALGGGICG